MQRLAFAAQSKGAFGVREYLQDNRQVAPDILHELSIFVEVEDGEITDDDREYSKLGICLEQHSLRVQRDIWSALASGASPSTEAAMSLAKAFLQVTAMPRRYETDAVCLTLAEMVLGVEESRKKKLNLPKNSAFRRRMRRLTLNQVDFSLHEFEAENMPKALSSEICSMTPITAYFRVKKRFKAETLDTSATLKPMQQNSRDKLPISTQTGMMIHQQPLLSKEVEDRASGLAKQLAQLKNETAIVIDDVASRAFDLIAEVVNDVQTSNVANEVTFQLLCKKLRMDLTMDEALFQITSALVDSNWSSRYAAIFLETSILPKICSAKSVISRVLLQTALRYSPNYSEALVDSLLLPLLVGGNFNNSKYDIGPPQAEAIIRILQIPYSIPIHQLDEYLRRSLKATTASGSANSSSSLLLSNDSALLVFQNIFSMKPALSSSTIELFIEAVETVLERPDLGDIKGSLKFATVIFTLISKFPQQCTGHVEILEGIVSQLTSIMAKTTLRFLQKLNKRE